MSNATILQNHNEIIGNNNLTIDELIESIDNLPEAGSGEVEITLQEKTITPSTSNQEVIADSSYDGLSKVTIKAVDSTIDSDIKASNIRTGINILGVTGTLEENEDLDAELTQQTSLLNNQSNVVDTIKKALVGKGTGSGETPEYTRVGYIQFTGNQTIDTGIICNQDTKLKVVFTREKSAQHYLFGVASSDNTASVTAYLGGSWRFGNKSVTKTLTTNEDMVYSGVLDSSQITITSSSSTISGVNDFETIGSLLIGTCRSASGAVGSPQFLGKIYSFEMWEGTEQVLKLIPMINKNGVYGFWDAISETFLTSITDVQLEGGV